MPERIDQMQALRRELARRCPAILHHRQAGLVAAFELDASRGPSDGRLSLALRSAALERGVLLRPLADTLYWMPALTITAAELERLAEVTGEVITEVLG
jgi:adenosylmethionine-8-amino-7-oxononanoate aminotransferase